MLRRRIAAIAAASLLITLGLACNLIVGLEGIDGAECSVAIKGEDASRTARMQERGIFECIGFRSGK